MQRPNIVRLVEQTALLSVQTLLGYPMSSKRLVIRGELERVGVLGAPSLIGFMIDQNPPLTSSHRSVCASTVVPRIFRVWLPARLRCRRIMMQRSILAGLLGPLNQLLAKLLLAKIHDSNDSSRLRQLPRSPFLFLR